ncbi:MAG: retroviral-like aspartic protease family protein [Bacteroidales bacterium]|nr:retroviral-like aspartic protease family protein [Bacteroidales bacterium]
MKKSLLFNLVFVILFGCSNSNNTTGNKQRIGIKMTKDGGVYTLPCLVNGVKMNFVFDTGASNVCISLTEALFLYKNGYIDDKDFGNETKSLVADGSVTTGMKLKIRTIEIGGIVLKNVDAIVSSSIEAPLLLGQSAIRKLGKIEMTGDSLFIIGKFDHSQESDVMNTSNVNEELCIKAWNAYKNDMPELALKYCDEAIDGWENSWMPYAVKGIVKISTAKFESDQKYALKDIEKAIELNEEKQTFTINEETSITYQDLLERVSFLYILNDNTQKALEVAQEGLTLYPKCVDLMDYISLAYTIDRNYKLAEKWANKVKELDSVSGYFRLGHLYDSQGRYAEAAKQYELYIAAKPNGYNGINNLADVYLQLGDEKKAIELKKDAAKKGSSNSQDWLKRNGYDW